MISYAEQKNGSVYVYNERNQTIWVKSGKLIGFTSSTFSIQPYNNGQVYTYSEKGSLISVH